MVTKAKLPKRLLKDLEYAASLPGRSHHDGGIQIGPKDARLLLAALELPVKGHNKKTGAMTHAFGLIYGKR